jgi:hypothetical protein
MFIERRLQKILFAPEERDIWSGQKHVSLLWSEALLLGKGSIDISPLCGEDRTFIWNYP